MCLWSFSYLSLPNRKPWTSSTGSFSPINVALASAPAVKRGGKINEFASLLSKAHYEDCCRTLNLSVIFGFVLLVFDGQLHSISRQMHFTLAGVLRGSQSYYLERKTQHSLHLDYWFWFLQRGSGVKRKWSGPCWLWPASADGNWRIPWCPSQRKGSPPEHRDWQMGICDHLWTGVALA